MPIFFLEQEKTAKKMKTMAYIGVYTVPFHLLGYVRADQKVLIDYFLPQGCCLAQQSIETLVVVGFIVHTLDGQGIRTSPLRDELAAQGVA